MSLCDAQIERFFPPDLPRVLITHTRPEAMLGMLRRIDGGKDRVRAHGYINRGGTLDAAGMLFANRSTWAHLTGSCAELLTMRISSLLSAREVSAVAGSGEAGWLS